MKIKMLVGFRGRETGEKYYAPGEIVDVNSILAERLVSEKRAVAIVEKQIEMPVAVVDEKPAAAPAQQKKKGRK